MPKMSFVKTYIQRNTILSRQISQGTPYFSIPLPLVPPMEEEHNRGTARLRHMPAIDRGIDRKPRASARRCSRCCAHCDAAARHAASETLDEEVLQVQ